jgi:hypothetical protein
MAYRISNEQLSACFYKLMKFIFRMEVPFDKIPWQTVTKESERAPDCILGQFKERTDFRHGNTSICATFPGENPKQSPTSSRRTLADRPHAWVPQSPVRRFIAKQAASGSAASISFPSPLSSPKTYHDENQNT